MKSDIFNFRRFGKYLKTDIKTCCYKSGLSLITISTILLLVAYIFKIFISLLVGNGWEGLGIGPRLSVFAVALLCLFVNMPKKCYGSITDKQYGSFWLTLPASKLEKFLSMIIICCILIPLCGSIIFLFGDAVLCAIDQTCGQSIISVFSDVEVAITDFKNGLGDISVEENAIVVNSLTEITSPWLYIDDFFGLSLPFLLGALMFKRSKTAKTILALIALSCVISAAASPLIGDYFNELTNLDFVGSTGEIATMVKSDIVDKIVMWDTISDTVFNLGFLTAIYFRIKTIKH